jgi:hypothetical protein
MRLSMKRPGCLAGSLIAGALLVLALVPCSLVASASLSGNGTLFMAPFAGLLVTKVSSQQTIRSNPTVLGFGSCRYSFPNNDLQIQVGGTLIRVVDCDP